jgi:hypothetical protein
MTALSFLMALFRAIPSLKAWFDDLVALYIHVQLQSMREENRDAIRKAFDTGDQKPIEQAIGNSNPGDHSVVPDSELRDTLPGVPNQS